MQRELFAGNFGPICGDSTASHPRLAELERQVLIDLFEGLTNKRIGERLKASEDQERATSSDPFRKQASAPRVSS